MSLTESAEGHEPSFELAQTDLEVVFEVPGRQRRLVEAGVVA